MKAQLSKAGLADRLTPVFEAYGYEGASLSLLAKAAGLSKASLYHHFPNGKRDMAAAVLARAGARLQTLVIAPLHSTASPVERLGQSLDGVARLYEGDIPGSLMNSLLVGEGRGLFGAIVAGGVAAWEQALAGVYEAAGKPAAAARDTARQTLERIEGALVLCRVEGSRVPLEGALTSLRGGL